MACSYCYVPFNDSKVTEREALRVIHAIRELGPRSVTLSGGDPFMYPFLPRLLAEVDDGERFIQIDTNAKSMRPRDISILNERVDLLGLPLDGSTTKCHGEMRDDPKHFAVVLGWLDRLHSEPVKIKINTVLSKFNEADMLALGCLLAERGIQRWSTYQFWPMEEGQKNALRFAMETSRYQDLVSTLRTSYPEIRIEDASIENRDGTYFFVTHGGLVYTVDPSDYRLYLQLGSIFESDIVDRWLQVANDVKQGQRIQERISDE